MDTVWIVYVDAGLAGTEVHSVHSNRLSALRMADRLEADGQICTVEPANVIDR